MGWQDRDYARPDADVGSFRRVGPPPSPITSRNIVTILIAVNVIAYILTTLTIRPDELGRKAIVYSPFFAWGAMINEAVLHGQVWRLVTSDYLHWSTMHIFVNMLVLYFLGRPLAQLWGPKKFFVVYTLAGLLGSLFYMVLGLLHVLQPGIAAGASGCVLGLLGAAAVLFPHAEVWIYFLFPIKIRTAAIIFAALYVWNIFTSGPNAGGDACHLAGLAFGAWFAWRGDAWWGRSGLRGRLTGRRGSGPVDRSSPSGPAPGKGRWAKKLQRRIDREDEVDRILKKVYEGGIQTLTPKERQILMDATERQRQEELRFRRGN
jgi:membrane associated rhomboid family serine protease